MREFAYVSRYAALEVVAGLPERKTELSAGYDIKTIENVSLSPGQSHMFSTGLKVYMEPDEYLAIHIRSSMAVKRGLEIVNKVCIIDADYVDNVDNEGHIFIPIKNVGKDNVFIPVGERIAQGIFMKFLTTNSDKANGKRTGGVGSTGN